MIQGRGGWCYVDGSYLNLFRWLSRNREFEVGLKDEFKRQTQTRDFYSAYIRGISFRSWLAISYLLLNIFFLSLNLF